MIACPAESCRSRAMRMRSSAAASGARARPRARRSGRAPRARRSARAAARRSPANQAAAHTPAPRKSSGAKPSRTRWGPRRTTTLAARAALREPGAFGTLVRHGVEGDREAERPEPRSRSPYRAAVAAVTTAKTGSGASAATGSSGQRDQHDRDGVEALVVVEPARAIAASENVEHNDGDEGVDRSLLLRHDRDGTGRTPPPSRPGGGSVSSLGDAEVPPWGRCGGGWRVLTVET